MYHATIDEPIVDTGHQFMYTVQENLEHDPNKFTYPYTSECTCGWIYHYSDKWGHNQTVIDPLSGPIPDGPDHFHTLVAAADYWKEYHLKKIKDYV